MNTSLTALARRFDRDALFVYTAQCLSTTAVSVCGSNKTFNYSPPFLFARCKCVNGFKGNQQ